MSNTTKKPKKHQSLLDIESLVKSICKTMREDSIKSGATTDPKYKIDWLPGDKELDINGKSTKAYKRFVFYVEETITKKEESTIKDIEGKNIIKESKEKQNILLYEGIYPNNIKSLTNSNQILEQAYKDFISNGIKTIAYYSYQNHIDNTSKQEK